MKKVLSQKTSPQRRRERKEETFLGQLLSRYMNYKHLPFNRVVINMKKIFLIFNDFPLRSLRLCGEIFK